MMLAMMMMMVVIVISSGKNKVVREGQSAITSCPPCHICAQASGWRQPQYLSVTNVESTFKFIAHCYLGLNVPIFQHDYDNMKNTFKMLDGTLFQDILAPSSVYLFIRVWISKIVHLNVKNNQKMLHMAAKVLNPVGNGCTTKTLRDTKQNRTKRDKYKRIKV